MSRADAASATPAAPIPGDELIVDTPSPIDATATATATATGRARDAVANDDSRPTTSASSEDSNATMEDVKASDVVEKKMSLNARRVDRGRTANGANATGAERGSRRQHESNKFLPWLPERATLEGTLEKKAEETSWFASVFGGATDTWNLRHFMLYETHLFWGKGFSTMHGYGTILSAKEAPEHGPAAFVIEMMAVPKRSLRRSLQENVDFMDLLSGLCCKPAGFKTMTLRAGSPTDRARWIDALQLGMTSSPLSARMPLECSDEIPPSPRVSTDSDRSSLDFSFGNKHKKYEEPPPPMSPGAAPGRLSQNAAPIDDEDVGKYAFNLSENTGVSSGLPPLPKKVLDRIPSALKKGSSFSTSINVRRNSSDGNSKSVTFNEHVETQVIAKSPSKHGLAAAEETDKEFRTRTRLLQAAGKFKIAEEELSIGAKLGVGSFGVVHRAKWNDTDVAYKTMIADKMNDDTINAFAEEIRMMRALRHPNIVLFLGAVIQRGRMGIVSELMKRGNLEQLLHGNGKWSESLRSNGMLRRQMAADCARGMLYLHSLAHPVVHHDLKPANLLVDGNWTLKVSDFGMSELKNYTYGSNCKAPGGTPEWMAPEALRGDDVNELSDVYSFGVILWELITLNFPWADLSSPVQIVAQVAFLHRRLKIPSWVEDPMEQLLHDCWTRETEARPTFASIVERLVGDYPAAWSQGKESKSAEQEAADILALMSKDDGSPTSAIEDDEFVDASDDIDVSVISAFAPRGLAPIRTPTPVHDATASRTLGSEDDSAEESNSLDSSAEVSVANSPRKPPLTASVTANVGAFRPKILSPLKTPRARAGVAEP